MPRLIAPYLIPWLLRLGARRGGGMMWQQSSGEGVALTFDDGPGRFTHGLLDVLSHEKVKATFFVLGTRCAAYPDVLRRMHHEGHHIGLHGMEHLSMNQLSETALQNAWRLQRAQLHQIVPDLPTIKWCRPPFGHAGDREVELARGNGLRIVQMSCLPGRHVLWPPGWEEPPDLMAKRVCREIRAGDILTLHDGEDIGLQDKVYTQPEVVETTRRVIDVVRTLGLSLDLLN
jgi:peptidoglycan-N-acetylglucosamine deacetylase